MGQRKPKKKKKIPRKRLLHFPNPYKLIEQNENALLYLFKNKGFSCEVLQVLIFFKSKFLNAL